MHRYTIEEPLLYDSAWRKFFDATYDEFQASQPPQGDNQWVNRVITFIKDQLWERHRAVLVTAPDSWKFTSMILEFETQQDMALFILKYA